MASASRRGNFAQSCSLLSGEQAEKYFPVKHWRKNGDALGFVKQTDKPLEGAEQG